jgi:lipopolysaccharide transport system ATP-binding protein
MDDTVIKVERLSKRYEIDRQRTNVDGFSHAVEAMVRAPLRWLRDRRERMHRRRDEFWALRDVSFDVRQGEIVGIIGRNGAGKSTVLKILSRITEPTEGTITLEGRVASLLEVGTGFHKELTGRENIFLNGAILGMSNIEIKRKFDEIVAFSEIERFLDTPVKRFSSGMYVRLAFAVAAHLDSEILVVDEVLAVGDAEFQKKCIGKMSDVRSGGRTILFVSHNMAAVRTLCTRGILLSNGAVAYMGDTERCIQEYENTMASPSSGRWVRQIPLKTGALGFTKLEVLLQGDQPSLQLLAEYSVASSLPDCRVLFALNICDAFGTPIIQALPSPEGIPVPKTARQDFRATVALPPLIPGTYTVTAWVGPDNMHTFDIIHKCASFTVHDSPVANRTFPHSPDHGFLVLPSTIARIPS